MGLAGALLGELVLFGRVVISDGEVCVVRAGPVSDALVSWTLTELIQQPQHRDVRIWLAFLAESASELVGRRLAAAGVWRRVEYRRFGRSRVSWLPEDVNVAAGAAGWVVDLAAADDCAGCCVGWSRRGYGAGWGGVVAAGAA